MEIKKVGVVGAGLMGSGIAQVCAQAGLQVAISDVSEEVLKKGLGSVNGFLTKSVEKEKITQQEKDDIMARIQGITDMKSFADCDVVIEAVTENMELKKKIFAELDKICPPATILASNSSALSIIDMATATGRMDKVVGLHFFNPAPLMRLLEVVQTIATSEETLQACDAFGKAIGKVVVRAKDTPGYIVNRLSIPFALNAIRMLESGVATREDIDNAVNVGLNHPMGPLALADFLGIDTLYYAARDMYEKFKEPYFAPPVLLEKMVAAGWYGRKAGKGFYDYK
jgi:3-hydroxybutyryl-CoA dehydrogenase